VKCQGLEFGLAGDYFEVNIKFKNIAFPTNKRGNNKGNRRGIGGILNATQRVTCQNLMLYC
jgi:hypothetical protein